MILGSRFKEIIKILIKIGYLELNKLILFK